MRPGLTAGRGLLIGGELVLGWLGLRDYGDARSLGSITQFGVQCCEREAFSFGEHQVGRIVGGEYVTAPRGKDRAYLDARRVDVDRKLAEQRYESSALGLGEAAPALSDQQDVGNLDFPQRRDYGYVVDKTIENGLSLRCRLVFEAPSQRHGGVDDEWHSAPPLADQVGKGQSAKGHAMACSAERAYDVAGLRSLAVGGHQLCHRDPVLSDDYALARCYCLKQPGQVRLCLKGTD